MKVRPAIKIHGGKAYLADWIVENFPEGYTRMNYVEPFFGGGSVLLNKLPPEVRTEGTPYLEVANDLDPGIVSIMQALRDEPEEFIQLVKKTRYSETVFKRELKRHKGPFENQLDHAFNEFVLRRMSRGGLKQAFAWSERLRGGQPGDVNAWKTIVGVLPSIAERLKNVYILNRSAMALIPAFDTPETLLYCDPPYLPETRVSKKAYGHEMTTDEHVELAEMLLKFQGKVILSGYPSPLYNRLFKDWRCLKRKIANHSSQQKEKKQKTECLWMNY